MCSEWPGGRECFVIRMSLGSETRGAASNSEGKRLCWLRDQLGPRFGDGLIPGSGPTAYRGRRFGVVPPALLGLRRANRRVPVGNRVSVA